MSSHQETREIIEPDGSGVVTITRTLSPTGTPTLQDLTVTGYSNEFGGQLVDTQVEASGSINGSNNLEIQIDALSGAQGGDYFIEYTVEDSGGPNIQDDFFYQNGVYSDSDAGDLSFRASAELERLSGTYEDGQLAQDPTDYSNLGGAFAESDLTYVSDSSPLTKHNGELIPYFTGSGTLTFPNPAFSSGTDARDSTSILVLQWNQQIGQSFPVARLTQGGKTYVEVRNEQGNIVVDSDFASSVLYEQSTHSGEIVVIETRIDTDENRASGSANREITQSPVSLSSEPHVLDPTTVELNPEDRNIDAKLFDVLAYDESISTGGLDRITKQLSYFYKADFTSPTADTVGAGSPKIQNHLLFDSEIEKYDMYVAIEGDSATRFDIAGTEIWRFLQDARSVAVDSRGKVAVGTSSNSNVHRLSSRGTAIWEFDGHTDVVEAVECGVEENTYSASRDGTVKKIGPEGIPVWNFGHHGDAVLDIAVFDELAVYTASADNTVRRIVDSTGSEDWSFTGHLDGVTAIAVSKDEIVYSGAANGELRAIDNDGNEIYFMDPFQCNAPITGIALGSDDELYITSGDQIKKLDAVDRTEIWEQDVYGSNSNKTAELDAIAVHPSGNVFVVENHDNLIMEFDDTGSKVNEFSVSANATDISIQPGTYEPHWR